MQFFVTWVSFSGHQIYRFLWLRTTSVEVLFKKFPKSDSGENFIEKDFALSYASI
jgi:hypothetical protein